MNEKTPRGGVGLAMVKLFVAVCAVYLLLDAFSVLHRATALYDSNGGHVPQMIMLRALGEMAASAVLAIFVMRAGRPRR